MQLKRKSIMPAPRILAMEIRRKNENGLYKGKKHNGKRIRSYKQMIVYELAERQKLIEQGKKNIFGREIKLHDQDKVRRHILKQNQENKSGKKQSKSSYRGPLTGIQSQ